MRYKNVPAPKLKECGLKLLPDRDGALRNVRTASLSSYVEHSMLDAVFCCKVDQLLSFFPGTILSLRYDRALL